MGAIPPPWHEGAEVGGSLPLARLEPSKSLQMYLCLPGHFQGPPAAWPGDGECVSAPLPLNGAAPPLA